MEKVSSPKDIAVLNVHTPSNRALRCMEVELKGKKQKNSHSLSVMDKTTGETTSETRVDLNNTIKRLD